MIKNISQPKTHGKWYSGLKVGPVFAVVLLVFRSRSYDGSEGAVLVVLTESTRLNKGGGSSDDVDGRCLYR